MEWARTHIQLCKDPECQECTELVEHGIVMCCDECGHPGMCDTDSGSWRVMSDGAVLCISCFHKSRRPDQDGNF